MGVVTWIAMIGCFVVFWALGGARMLSMIGEQAAQAAGSSGFEAFVFMHLNLVVFFCVVVATAAVSYLTSGGKQQ